jgi:polyferredoxin
MSPKPRLQSQRRLAQIAFFLLFVLAPLFDLFRYDLTQGHAYFLTMPWRLGLDDFLAGRISAAEAGRNVFLMLFLPFFGTIAVGALISWRWGRLYCGWLCPHFSVVETINDTMKKASGKHSLWDKQEVPPWQPDGSPAVRDKRWWLLVLPLAVGFALVWAVVLLTYLMPPLQVYAGLLSGDLKRGEVIFIAAATLVISAEFLFARHLFCRFGCAIGLFQSLLWMSNKEAMVVGVDRQRLAECGDCLDGHGSACDAVCPMRLKPRTMKRWMFACTQCGQCIDACDTVNQDKPAGKLLRWVEGEAARQNEAGFITIKKKED